MNLLEVYKITNIINNKVYIGITTQGILIRWYKHISDSKKGSSYAIHNALRFHGKENFQIETIEVVDSIEDLKLREIYWINYYDSYNRNKGYNLTLGGDGTFGKSQSEETKCKIRNKAFGRKHKKTTKEKMSISQKQINRDYSKIGKIGNNKRWSIKENHYNSSINNHNNRKVFKYSFDMILLKEYISLSEAERDLNIPNAHTNISRCAAGKVASAYGFIWKYCDAE